ncbi:MAG TPA: endonuclease [Amaricoccus sp.]|uniref:endonuclease n=1 Tax=Amaricoccus sp. TaxID=1872485 RepID=UPI002B6999A2|nr:endonuclease [Amaricoccus sp.]HMQ93754.1 endonuclease [Amaricoccus sp.]HMR53586.1 endonuclease [Amaricoccus sp.]HMR61736.1 endonuclease [Amaricoccus sp.]HMU00597.1 endonuclease [Amaricoccus sp.]
MAEGRGDQESFLSPTMTWIAAAVAGLIVALVLAVIFGVGWLASFVLGLIVFFGAGWVLGRIAAPDQPPAMLKSPAEIERSAAASPEPVAAPPAEPVAPPAEPAAPAPVPEPEAAPAPVDESPAREAEAAPAAKEAEPSPAARDTAISERVRQAARAAGEAAKLMQDQVEPARPAGLEAARGGAADDLKRIKGVGPKLEALLNSLGYYHFDQIAAWSAAEVAWIDAHLEGFHGRATRDEWVPQAKLLAAGEETEFSKRVDKGDVY